MSDGRLPSISVVLPVFEEEAQIEALLEDVVATLNSQAEDFEVVVVDDGSGDDTFEVLKAVHAKHPVSVRVARHLRNRGNGAALRTGIRLARKDIVVTMDADGQHSPEDIGRLLERIPPYDLVIGARTGDYRGRWYRNLANGLYSWLAGWLTEQPIDDLTSGFRAMRRDAVIHFLPLFPEGFSAPTTTTMSFIKAGYNVAFVPIHVRERLSGRSKIRLWRDGSRFMTIIGRMIMLYDPLRIFLPVGGILVALGTLSWAVGLWAARRPVMPNSTIFLYSSAVMTWLLGMVADQISSWRVQRYGDESVELLEEEAEH